MKITTLKQYLKQPYPYFYEIRNVLYISILIFFMTLFFNYFFEPFEVNKKELKMNFFWISFIHAFIPFCAILFGSILLLFKKKIVDNWSIKKEIIFILLLLLAIGVGQFLIRDSIYNNPDNWSLKYLVEEVKNTFLIGGLFLIIIVPMIHNHFVKRHQNTIKNIGPIKEKVSYDRYEEILIQTQLKTNTFYLNPSALLFALSDGNYTEIFFLEQKKLSKKLFRMPLKDFEAQLSTCKFIMRTHRSFVVNLTQIKHIEGNAQGFKLSFKVGNEKALVSRKMIADFKKEMKNIQY